MSECISVSSFRSRDHLKPTTTLHKRVESTYYSNPPPFVMHNTARAAMIAHRFSLSQPHTGGQCRVVARCNERRSNKTLFSKHYQDLHDSVSTYSHASSSHLYPLCVPSFPARPPFSQPNLSHLFPYSLCHSVFTRLAPSRIAKPLEVDIQTVTPQRVRACVRGQSGEAGSQDFWQVEGSVFELGYALVL